MGPGMLRSSQGASHNSCHHQAEASGPGEEARQQGVCPLTTGVAGAWSPTYSGKV